jgi:hypothetical protein
VDRLSFGTTARKRARRRKNIRRLSLVAWVASTVALAGGPLYGLNEAGLIDLGLEGPKPVPSSSAASAEIVIDSSRHLAEEPTNRRRDENPDGLGRSDSAGSVTEIIHAAAAKHGVDGDYLVSIAACESGLDPTAVNSAGYHGLFQYAESTWAAYGSGDIYDPVAQAEATAKLIAAGQSSHWPNCA